MPDPNRATVSASQAAGLWNASNYVTRWMLYQHFANGMNIDDAENTRMGWGKRLQSVILEAAAEEMRLEIHENTGDTYVRHPELRIGCTRDAHVFDPSRGLGIVEAKNVDSWIYRSTWLNGIAPRHIELQHQVQLMVPDPKHGMPQWGAIVAFVGGNEVVIHPRTVNKKLEPVIIEEVDRFFDDVANKREPDPFGNEREIPLLNELYPRVDPDLVLDLSGDPEALLIDELLEELQAAQGMKREGERLQKALTPRVLALAKEASRIDAVSRSAKITKSARAATLSPLPAAWVEAIKGTLKALEKGEIPTPEQEAILNEIVLRPAIETRRASLANIITITERASDLVKPKPTDFSEYLNTFDQLHSESPVMDGTDRTTGGWIGQP